MPAAIELMRLVVYALAMVAAIVAMVAVIYLLRNAILTMRREREQDETLLQLRRLDARRERRLAAEREPWKYPPEEGD